MMAIEELPADQRAVLRLLLEQGRSYSDIAATLEMAPATVRDRAHEALTALGPDDTPLGRERRAQVADWLLGQQSSVERQSTDDLLRGSASARTWARAVAAQVGPLAVDALPALPGDDDAPAAPAAVSTKRSLLVDDDSALAASPTSGKDAPAHDPRQSPRAMERPSSHRGGVALLAVAALLATLGAGVLIGRATKGDDEKKTSTAAQSSNIKVLGQTNLKPPAGAKNAKAAGIAQFVERKAQNGGAPQKLLNVIAQGLPRAPADSGYGVWLIKTGSRPVWLGYFQAVTTNGEVGAQSPLKVDPKGYERVILTRQQGQTPKTPGTVYLEGPVKLTAAASG